MGDIYDHDMGETTTGDVEGANNLLGPPWLDPFSSIIDRHTDSHAPHSSSTTTSSTLPLIRKYRAHAN